MSKLIFAIAALSFLAITITPAKACPSGYHYSCTAWGTKVECGCVR
jgi:hypothetical protein